MKQLLSLLFIGCSVSSFGGTFTSAVTTGNFNDASTWSFTGDADGVPDLDDNVTILSGHTVTLASSSVAGIVNDVTINNGGQLVFNKGLTVYGHYINNGVESGTSAIFLRGVSKNLGGSGTFSPTLVLNISPGGSYTIQAGTTITKTNPTLVNFGTLSSLTNLGNFTIWKAATATGATGIVFTNGSTGVLELGAHSFMAGHTFNASAAGNTVRIKYSFNQMPQPVGGVYHHLIIISPGVQCSQNTTVNGNLTINASGNLLSNNFDLNLKGNFTRNGPFTASANHSVTFSGTTTQTISTSVALASTPIDFQGLVINNPTTVSLGNGTYRLFERLTIQQGTFNVNNRPFVFRSDATKTAVIGSCGATAAFSNASGCTLERFISARIAGHSDMSSPVTSATFTDWDNELIMIYDYGPPMNYPSAFGYSESAADYVPITDASTPIEQGVGYSVYLDSDGNQNTWNAATINTIGTPTIGPLDISGSITFDFDGWNFIGNPYQAHLSWDALQASVTDISTDMMIYDEVSQDFETFSTGMGVTIAPTQGFWVNTTSGASNFVFTEAIKSTSTSSDFRSAQAIPFEVRLKNIDGSTHYTSGARFKFMAGANAETPGQVSFKKVPHPHAPMFCAVSAEGKKMRVSVLDAAQEKLIVPMKFSVGKNGKYSLTAAHVDNAAFEGYTCISLIDHQTGITTDLLEGSYVFDAQVDENENRFTVVLSKEQGCVKSAMAETIGSAQSVEITSLSQGNTVIKTNLADNVSARVTLTDLLGQNIVPAQTIAGGTQTTYLSVPTTYSGIYLVNVFYGDQVESKKLFK